MEEPKDKNIHVRYSNIKQIMEGAKGKGVIDNYQYLKLMMQITNCLKVSNRNN